MAEEQKLLTDNTSPPPNHKRKKMLFYFCLPLLLICLIILIYWFVWGRFEESTDDAYVNGNQVSLNAQIAGSIATITADNTDFVPEGRVLVTLDPINSEVAFARSCAELGNTIRSVVDLFLNVEKMRANKEQSRAELYKTALDYQNRKDLVLAGAVSQEDFEHAEAALWAAYAGVEAAEAALDEAIAQVSNTTVRTHPMVEQSKEQVKEAYVNLQRCSIQAPVSGIVAQRGAQVGDWVNPTDPLLAIVPLEQIWIDANFKENQLAKLRIGQPVTCKADMYGRSVIYHGKISGIGAGTGSVFSLLPPQNATGNWIKIVQRLPVRIVLDPDEVKKNPLRLGLSVEVTVDLHNLKGAVIPKEKPIMPIYQTDIFKTQLNGAEEVIERIFSENLPGGV